jgi:cytoskeletal protein CcmA (bactofilin family)
MDPDNQNQPLDQEGVSLEGSSPVIEPGGGNPSATQPEQPGSTKPTNARRVAGLLRHFNIYLLAFLIVIVIAVAVVVITIINGNKSSTSNQTAPQTLSPTQLEKLASSAPTIGSSNQTLNIAANTILSGNVLARKDLDVAGALTAGSLNLAQLTVSGTSYSGQNSTNKLTVNGTATITGAESVSGILSVAGASSFGGVLSADQISVQALQLAGNLTLNKHILVTGSNPGQSIGPAVGTGGTASDSGSDTAGSININTGSNPPANSCFITITFAQPFSTTPYVEVTPIGSAAGGLQYYVTRSTTSMSVCTNSAAPATAVFGFDYVILG